MNKLKSPLNKMKSRFTLILMVIGLVFCVLASPLYVVSAANVEPDPIWKPIEISSSDILIDASYELQYTLEAGKIYHIFLVGNWTEEDPLCTDYDVFVYGPNGETYRFTEAKGIPEQVFNDEDGRYFTPETSGVYTFEIHNDSEHDVLVDPALFMLIEHVETDRVYNATLLGRTMKNGPWPEYSALTYACEFTTAASDFTVHVDTPDDIDLYEVRLYKMATLDAHGHDINGVPTPFGTDFYSNVTNGYGGFNYTVGGVRSPVIASCVDYGVDIELSPCADDSPTTETATTYFLVFIAEYSKENSPSTVPFYIKIDNTAPEPTLTEPLGQIIAGCPLSIRADVSTSKKLASVWVNYAVNGLIVDDSIPMVLVGDQYECKLPEFLVNDAVEYSISAMDELGNIGVFSSSFVVMGKTTTTCDVSTSYVIGGGALDVSGSTTRASSLVTLNFTCGSYNEIIPVASDSSGHYSYSYTPKRAGEWTVAAVYAGDDEYSSSTSALSAFIMEPQYTSISCSVITPSVKIGDDVELLGNTSPPLAGVPIEILLASGSELKTLTTTSGSDGSFKISEQLGEGQWDIVAQVKGNWRFLPSSSGVSTASVIPLTSTERMIIQLMSFTNPPSIYVIMLASGIVLVLLLRWKSSVIAPKLPAPVRNFFTRFSTPAAPKRRQPSGERGSYKRRSGEPEP